MPVITIREREATTGGFKAELSFDQTGSYPITVTKPFSGQEEELLEWYFEEHLRFPFVEGTKAAAAAESVTRYGETLFKQVFADTEAFVHYRQATQEGLEGARVEIIGSPEFHALHWESMKDPKLEDAFALRSTMVRKNSTPQIIAADARPSPTINLLIVTARPGGKRDVGYRTISRPLVGALRKAGVRVQIDILRPGTYEALSDHLEGITAQQGKGFYHVIHFDVHGAVLDYEEFKKGAETNRLVYQSRFGRDDIEPYAGLKAFLFLEGEADDQADPVEASELAALLIRHQVPITILNACQSGKQIGASETSLGSRLMQAGAQMVLAMGYSVTVTAAELMMTALYEQLFAGREMAVAIRLARQELRNRKGRRAYFNQIIDLEDWLLPVVYENREIKLATREFTPEEQAAYYERQSASYPFPQPAYGFHGRDLDILEIEKRLLKKRNLLLLRGMGGAGKTTLLNHLGAWWQTTGFVDRVFYFGYDERAWTRQQIIDDIAKKLMKPVEYAGFQPMSLDAQQKMLTEKLRARRHLLILDNLESITGSHLAIKNILPEEEREALRGFLQDLADGRTIALLGSRGGEQWLSRGTFEDNVYDVPGLDAEAASAMAEKILERFDVKAYRKEADFEKLLKLLDGYPLAMEVVFANLKRQKPGEVLAALQAGDVALDRGDTEKKTESILRCIDYSHSNLSVEAQGLLMCLAPFSLVFNTQWIEPYTEQLRQQPALAHLPFDRWGEVLQEAANWGLVSPDPEQPVYLRLQPIFPYFLRAQLNAPEQKEIRQAVETAFRQHYDELGRGIAALFDSKEAKEKQIGFVLASLEYENLATALNLALKAQVSIWNPYVALSFYIDATKDHRRGLALGETVLARLESYTADKLTERLGAEFVGILGDIADSQLSLSQYSIAETSYQKVLSLIEGLTVLDRKGKDILAATIYHGLGMIAEARRMWEDAEKYYHQTLQLLIEHNERSAQARTYNQLGTIAKEQQQWEKAEKYLEQTLLIFSENDDRYEQARVLHNLGIIKQRQEQGEKAEMYYNQALRILDEYDRYEQAKIYNQLGNMAQEQKQWKKAEMYYQEALKIKIEYNDLYSQFFTYHSLGALAAQQQQWLQARDYYLKALSIIVKFEDEHKRVATLFNLARLWHESGDAGLPVAVAGVLKISPEEAEELMRGMKPADESSEEETGSE